LGQLPAELKLKSEALTSLALANACRMSSMIPCRWLGAERLFGRHRDWSITIASGCCARKTSLIRVLLPEPATPVTTVSYAGGNATVTFFRLCRLAFS
jgi:hypothetical protein